MSPSFWSGRKSCHENENPQEYTAEPRRVLFRSACRGLRLRPAAPANHRAAPLRLCPRPRRSNRHPRPRRPRPRRQARPHRNQRQHHAAADRTGPGRRPHRRAARSRAGLPPESLCAGAAGLDHRDRIPQPARLRLRRRHNPRRHPAPRPQNPLRSPLHGRRPARDRGFHRLHHPPVGIRPHPPARRRPRPHRPLQQRRARHAADPRRQEPRRQHRNQAPRRDLCLPGQRPHGLRRRRRAALRRLQPGQPAHHLRAQRRLPGRRVGTPRQAGASQDFPPRSGPSETRGDRRQHQTDPRRKGGRHRPAARRRSGCPHQQPQSLHHYSHCRSPGRRGKFRTHKTLPHGHVEAILMAMRKLGLDSLLATKHCRERDLVMAMIAARLVHPCSKLAATREWHTTTLAEELSVADATEDDLYQAMDWLLERQPRIEKKLAARHLGEDCLVLYDVSSSYYEGHTCPLAQYGHDRDGKKGLPIIVYGVMTDGEGRPIAVEVYPGNTGDPTTVADQVEKLRDRFHLSRVVLVGDRGMLTPPPIDKMKMNPGLGWDTALTSVAIRGLLEAGSLQLSFLDETNLAEITSPDYPGERLMVCHNPLLEEERGRKRRELLQATEKDRKSTRLN